MGITLSIFTIEFQKQKSSEIFPSNYSKNIPNSKTLFNLFWALTLAYIDLTFNTFQLFNSVHIFLNILYITFLLYFGANTI